MDVPQAVEVRVPAEATQLPVLRAVANTIAMREDFDLDAIADVTMAVDELCSQLIVRAAGEAVLVCRFIVDSDRITLHGSVGAKKPDPLSVTSFGWRVLSTLVDSVRTWAQEPAELHIEAVKSRGGVAAG
ncbi:hypothetical protein GCM10009765_51520 [Fodinicola feengrottensis]|uniref:Anti-sigma factor n=1 Tax=Fodinicola feengrottensis TaxID=435914 RepID=A0ABN2HZ49_9ACTN